MRPSLSTALLTSLVTMLLGGSCVARAGPEGLDVFFVRVLKDAGSGLSRYERAGWLVGGQDGSVRFVEWPATDRVRGHAWQGPVPPGTIALVHTHPADGNQRPSLKDKETAERLGIPVFTVSIWGIFRADPHGEVIGVSSPFWVPSIDWVLAGPLLALKPETQIAGLPDLTLGLEGR